MPTNIGNQTVSVFFHSVANSGTWNKRQLNVRQVGIYTGGWLTVVNATTARISALVCEITDGTYQVRISTGDTVNITVNSSTPYLVLRWAYGGTTADYMELMAVASPNANDLILGRCTFAGGGALNGFDYSERSNPSTHDQYLKVEPTGDNELRVRIRGGYYQTSAASVQVPDQKSDAVTPPLANSQVYLVYVDTDGTVRIDSTGTPGVNPVAPDYAGKLVLAEITLAAGATTITTDDIKDVRPFVTGHAPSPDGVTILTDGSGNLKTRDPVYNMARTIGSQLVNLSTWTKVSAQGTVKYSGIGPVVSGVYTLPASKLYKLSYSVVFGALSSTPIFEARWRVLTGDITWWFADDEYNQSMTKVEAKDGDALVTLSGTFLFLPSVQSTVQLEVKTRDAAGQYGHVLYATTNIWAE